MKKEIRILGIDDSSFKKKQIKEILVIATVFRGGSFLIHCQNYDGNTERSENPF